MASSAYSVKGQIKDQQGAPLAGVAVKVSGAITQTVQTDGSGSYSIQGLIPSATYSLIPEKPAYDFTPPTLPINNPTQNVTANFTGQARSYNITGKTLDSSGLPLSSVRLSLAGKHTQTVDSDVNGEFEFKNITGAESYVLSPDKINHTFTPPSLPVVYLTDNIKHTFFGSAAPDRDKAPSQWTVLNDYSKTIITLASGLLVATVTFSSQLTRGDNDSLSVILLSLTWFVLAITIAFGVLTAVYTIQFLRNNREGALAVRYANWSYISLGVAGVLFLVFGIYVVWAGKRLSPADALEKAATAIPANATWTFQFMQWDPAAKRYEVSYSHPGTAEKLIIKVDPQTRTVTTVEAQPPLPLGSPSVSPPSGSRNVP